MTWDTEHQVLVIQRAVDTKLVPGQVFEVEVCAGVRTPGVQVCVNFVADVTEHGASFQPEPLVPISHELLLKTLSLARRFS